MTAEAKEGTWEGGRRCTQAKGTERRQSRGNRRLEREEQELCTSSPAGANQSRRLEDRLVRAGRGERGRGSRSEASCQFQTDRCLYIPSRSSQRLFFFPKDVFCAFSTSLLRRPHLHTASCRRPGLASGLITGWRRPRGCGPGLA